MQTRMQTHSQVHQSAVSLESIFPMYLPLQARKSKISVPQTSDFTSAQDPPPCTEMYEGPLRFTWARRSTWPLSTYLAGGGVMVTVWGGLRPGPHCSLNSTSPHRDVLLLTYLQVEV